MQTAVRIKTDPLMVLHQGLAAHSLYSCFQLVQKNPYSCLAPGFRSFDPVDLECTYGQEVLSLKMRLQGFAESLQQM